MWGLWQRRRLVVARRWISLAAAWRYARATGRTLAVDWRHSTYRHGARNVFDLVFEPPSTLAGVPVLSGDDVARHYGGRYWPQGWRRSAISRAGRRGERGDLALAVSTIRAGHDVAADVVVFDDCLAHAAPSAAEQRAVYAELVPRPALRQAAAAFREAHGFADRPVLGVHVRHGIGGYVGDHARHWRNPARTAFELTGLIEASRRRLQVTATEPLMFLCTDSVKVQQLMQTAFPALVVRPKAMLDAWRGELHRTVGAASGLADAAVEMLLLAEADVLIRFPAGSFFSHWAAIMKRPASLDLSGLAEPGLEAAIC